MGAVATPEQVSKSGEQAPEEPVWNPEWLTWQPEAETRSKRCKKPTKAVTLKGNTSATQVPEVDAAAPALDVEAPPLWQPSRKSGIPQWALPFQRANQEEGKDQSEQMVD